MIGDLNETKKIQYVFTVLFPKMCVHVYSFFSNKNYVAYTLSCRIKSINMSIQAKNADFGNGGRRRSLQL